MDSQTSENNRNTKVIARNTLGLTAGNDRPVPLKSIKVDVHITGYVAEVSSSLTYYNAEDTPIEAVFTFPVNDGSAVFQFEADIDGRHIVAEIQEREQAQLTYQDAIDHGKTAMLLKEDNSARDIFSCILGNLPPQKEASLVMKYVIELPQEADGRLRFTLPTVLNPRYSPDTGKAKAAEGATYVPPSKVPYEFSMNTTVQGYHKVTAVTSDRVQLDVKFEENNKIAKVNICDEFKFDHDLQFLVQYEIPFTPQIVLEDGNPEAEGLLKKDMLMVSFHPDLKEVAMATKGEYIFVIDRSASMSGDKIKNAKEALLLFLKSLPPDCYFNIVSFGSWFSSLFSHSSMKYTEESLNEAINLQERMIADMSGTEILDPLENVFSRKLIPKHPRRVFILTDGEVSNTNAVIGLVRKQSTKTNTRVYTLGIGQGVSTALVKGIANNGGGKAEFIADRDRIQPKVISLLKCAMQPVVTDITMDWDLPPGVTTVSIPSEPPSLISPGERLTLFAILQGVEKNTICGPSSVTLKGQQDENHVSFKMTITLCEADDFSTSVPVHRLATKHQIKVLQDQEAAVTASDDDYTGKEKCETIKSLREKIISISRQGNIVSKYTSFVAIDTEGKVEGKSVQRSCPVPTLSQDYVKGISRTVSSKSTTQTTPTTSTTISETVSSKSTQTQEPTTSTTRAEPVSRKSTTQTTPTTSTTISEKMSSKSTTTQEPTTSTSTTSPTMSTTTQEPTTSTTISETETVDSTDVKMSVGEGGIDEENTDNTLKKASIRSAASINNKQKVDQMMSVITLQQLRGQWNMSDELLQLLEVAKEEIDKLDISEDLSIVCTVIVLSWLRQQFSHRQEEWQMIETKALSWISSQNLNTPTDDLIKKATQALWPK